MDTVHVSDLAIINIRRLRDEFGDPTDGLRFGLSGGGCSGYKYVLEFEAAANKEDNVFHYDDISVFVKVEDMEKLKNSTIDWETSMMNEGFKIENPQAKNPCGCGSSVDF